MSACPLLVTKGRFVSPHLRIASAAVYLPGAEVCTVL